MRMDQHNYLIHWLKKGEKAKYVDKIKLANGRWRYFYSQAELEAYKLKRKLGASAGELANKAKQGLHGLKEGALDTGARAVVGVARKSEFVSDRIGGMEKLALDRYKNTANQYNAEARGKSNLADRERAKAISAYRHGQEERVNDAMDREHGLRRQARKARAEATDWQRIAAEGQEKYDKTLLGRAEARVKRADVRKATEATRNKLLGAASKASTKKTEDRKAGSIFRDAQGDLDRLKREQEARKKSRSSSVFKDGQADLERQKRERESRAKQKNSSVFKNGREELERQKAMRSKSNRPQSRKKHVTSEGTGVHKRSRIDYSRFER